MLSLVSTTLPTTTNPNHHNHAKLKLDWNDRIGLQKRFTPTEKGWTVRVDWRSTEHGTGVFAEQAIPSGTVLRRGILGTNLLEFASAGDIEEFCGASAVGGTDATEKDSFDARLRYAKDYLWGFYKDNADERGYPPDESDNGDNYDDEDDDRFFGMWVPGNGLNHNAVPNTVYRWRESEDPTSTGGGGGGGIDLVALVDIETGEELVDDYRRHGKSAPLWLREFAAKHNVTLNFADCNDFV